MIDTNVLVAGLRSTHGYAYRLLQLVGTGRFGINLSVPLVLEYEDVLYHPGTGIPVSREAIDAVLNYHCSIAHQQRIFFLWRPFLRDSKDDMVLELAVNASCDFIVTYNKDDFKGVETQFELSVVSPREFLFEIGSIE
ncbi:MAG: putative toxin-antitoxin system toxin component, PIN family [Caldilineaceae bacterium]|nr:putative toxin-antitoxin system toxin component, PIN family [Caldilineaceae bacterium]